MILGLIVVEIVGLILLGRIFGLVFSIIWIIITFFLGLSIFKSVVNSNFSNLLQGSIRQDDEVKYYLSIASFALMLPGIISDLVGIALLIYAGYLAIVNKFDKRGKNAQNGSQKRDTIIDITEQDYKERK